VDREIDKYIYEWMDVGWVDEWIDGWVDEWIDGWMDG
jgi:hypothetical protein